MIAELSVHSFQSLTYANGPGARCCLWLQGCTLACPGCFNPETHSFDNGNRHKVSEVLGWLEQSIGIEGLTVSGGEPLQQADGLLALLKLVRRKTALTTLLFTGFAYQEVEQMPFFKDLRHLVDLLIAGRYVANASPASNFSASPGKTFHFFSDRYSKTDLETVPTSEVIINSRGDAIVTGVDPLRLRRQ